jgi:hypothetical protein
VPLDFSVQQRPSVDQTCIKATTRLRDKMANQMSAWNHRLGRSFGKNQTFEFKTLRRAMAAALPGKSLRGLDQETRGYTNPVREEVRS